jgi:hypothetical protein
MLSSLTEGFGPDALVDLEEIFDATSTRLCI